MLKSFAIRVFKDKKVPGFSLVEVSIVLLIIGIVTGAMLKGRSLIDSVRLDSVVSDIRNLQTAYVQYISSYSAMPGQSSSGTFNAESANNFFPKLAEVGLIESPNFKKPKIGSSYQIIAENDRPYIRISGLDDKKINLLKTKLAASISENIETKSNSTTIDVRLD